MTFQRRSTLDTILYFQVHRGCIGKSEDSPMGLYIPEENCILDKETLLWITADDDTEDSPDVRSAKRQKLEGS